MKRENQMSNAMKAEPAPITFHIETPNYIVRFLNPDDATERVASWFNQPEIRESFNMSGDQHMTLGGLVQYIKGFDRHTNGITGRFRKSDGLLVAISNVQINWEIRRFLIKLIVGEPLVRHTGSTLEVMAPSFDLCFEELDLRVMTATALATNKPVNLLLEKVGATLDKVLPRHTRSHKDGSFVDLNLFSLQRDAWRKWKAENSEMIEMFRDSSRFSPSV
jgi:RimJ/RimL family protein N-acetyltransferase